MAMVRPVPIRKKYQNHPMKYAACRRAAPTKPVMVAELSRLMLPNARSAIVRSRLSQKVLRFGMSHARLMELSMKVKIQEDDHRTTPMHEIMTAEDGLVTSTRLSWMNWLEPGKRSIIV